MNAAVATQPHQRSKLERLCRYVARPPLDFIARLAALVPRPRVNLIRYHGVFAPNSKLRRRIVPAINAFPSARPRQKDQHHKEAASTADSPLSRRLSWAERLRHSPA